MAALRQYRHRASLQLRADRVVSQAALLGRAHRLISEARARSLGGCDAQGDSGGRRRARRNRHPRHQYDHRTCDTRASTPNCSIASSSRRRWNGCRYSALAAAAASPAWRGRRVWRRRPKARMCCSSPSTCAACACASTIRARRCSCPPRCSATARPACCCATRRTARAAARAFSPSANGAGRETEHIMGWDIKDDGFGVVLSPELPSLMRKALAPALHDFLDRNGFRLSDFNGFLFHPGGRKLIETMQEVLGLERAATRTFVGGVARLRQHVVGDGFVRARAGAQGRRPRPASAGGVRAGLFRLFRRGRSVMDFGSGAILLAYLTVQRLIELWWAKAKRGAAHGIRRHRIRPFAPAA